MLSELPVDGGDDAASTILSWQGAGFNLSPQSVAGPDVELVEGLGLAEMVQRDLVRLVVDSKVIAAYYEAFSRTKVEHSP